ncbi:hypothetical protein [Bauldia litoralis]|uniref:Uncharacterized protein n=1 Tax=Bauldia litoralis TaxID=665467 RepID=A0A1G6DI48_9HYPH|nr:hypothetical protein [Bauldia litoralis]SDB44813.1 hypothetical protein SAMN02982931_03426 [Bauldia litoralis]
MANVSLGDRSSHSPRASRWLAAIRLHPFVYLALALVALAGIGYGVSVAIEDYHDRIALRGLDGQALPVRLIVAGEPVVVPANMLRSRKARRGGAVDKVDFLLHWPTLEGFSEERAADFRDTAPDAPLIFITVSARENSLDSDARLDSIYERFFEGPELAGPAGLAGRALDAESGYGGEVVYYGPPGVKPFVARCIAADTPDIPATCIRDVNIGQGLSMLYRFNQKYLADWRTMDDRLRRLFGRFFRTP